MGRKVEKKATILTITGSDSTGGSGVQADIKTITMLGAYAATAITSVTAQDTEDIQHLYDIPAEVLEMQVNAVLNDLKPTAVKVGMLRSVEQVWVVERLLKQYSPRFVVLDAVVISSKGNVLMPQKVVDAMVSCLFPLSSIVIIRQDSAAYMQQTNTTHNNEELEALARKIMKLGCQSVVLQGGVISTESLTDVLVEENSTKARFYTRPGFIDRITHGAGGAFTSAVAVYLCMGNDMEKAIELAQEYMRQLILRSADSDLGVNRQLLDHSNDVPRQSISGRVLELYNQLMDDIAMHHKTNADVRFYAKKLNVTPRYLAQITRRVAGRTPKQLIDDYIIKEVETHLLGRAKTIQEVAFACGFSSQVQFNKFFKKMRGCAPGEFRKAHILDVEHTKEL